MPFVGLGGSPLLIDEFLGEDHEEKQLESPIEPHESLGEKCQEEHMESNISGGLFGEKCNKEKIERSIEPNELFGEILLEKQPKNNISEVQLLWEECFAKKEGNMLPRLVPFHKAQHLPPLVTYLL
jgi:hypothetical protein